MTHHELLYSHSSVAIAAVLFVAIIVFNELGFRIGRFVQARTDSEYFSNMWTSASPWVRST